MAAYYHLHSRTGAGLRAMPGCPWHVHVHRCGQDLHHRENDRDRQQHHQAEHDQADQWIGVFRRLMSPRHAGSFDVRWPPRYAQYWSAQARKGQVLTIPGPGAQRSAHSGGHPCQSRPEHAQVRSSVRPAISQPGTAACITAGAGARLSCENRLLSVRRSVSQRVPDPPC